MKLQEWGFCPHQDEDMCEDCTIDPSQRSFHQSELLDLTHRIQVEIFGWCSCEDNEGKDNPYTDCPTKGEQQ